MSRKRRTRRGGATTAVATPIEQATAETPAQKPKEAARLEIPQWKWRTFPVYFAFSLGLFIGVYAGWSAGFIAGDKSGNTLPSLAVFAIAAVLLGFGVARFSVRGLMGWGVIKPTTRKAPKSKE